MKFKFYYQPSLILPSLLGGWLMLICHSTPTPAQTPLPNLPSSNNDLLPPVPTNTQQYVIPQANPNPQEYTNYGGVVPVVPFNQNNQNFERYLVYINGGNPQTLQQIRQIEPTAYIRQFQGRSVIQVGIFSQPGNAQQRVQQLAAYGINGAQIVTFSNGQQISTYSPNFTNTQNFSNTNVYQPKPSKHYYVAVPASSTEAASIANQIQENVRQQVNITTKNQPHGSHVAVGPFAERSEAEQWNSYLRSMGFGNARVYYAK